MAERDAARAAKDFATADEMRDRLDAMGLEVMDTAGRHRGSVRAISGSAPG